MKRVLNAFKEGNNLFSVILLDTTQGRWLSTARAVKIRYWGNTERIIRAWLRLLGPECTEGFSTAGGHQEEVREALADVA